MFLILIILFILIVFSFVFLFYKINLLNDELNDLYNTCYTYISNSFKIGANNHDEDIF